MTFSLDSDMSAIGPLTTPLSREQYRHGSRIRVGRFWLRGRRLDGVGVFQGVWIPAFVSYGPSGSRSGE